MNIIDISWPISQEMTSYKNKKSVEIKQTKSIATDHVMESHLSLNVHSGTHVDAPAHFLPQGRTIDELPLDSLCGFATVLDLTRVNDVIEPEDIVEHTIKKDAIILLKTKNSFLSPTASFHDQFVYLSAGAAHYLSKQKIKAIGIDYLGIERNQPTHETHTIFMQQQIPIIEGLRLAHVAAGNYFFIAFPLHCIGLDAAPARAVLFEGII